MADNRAIRVALARRERERLEAEPDVEPFDDFEAPVEPEPDEDEPGDED